MSWSINNTNNANVKELIEIIFLEDSMHVLFFKIKP